MSRMLRLGRARVIDIFYMIERKIGTLGRASLKTLNSMISFYKEKAQKPLKTLGFFSLRLHRYIPRLTPKKNYAKSEKKLLAPRDQF